MSKVEPNDIVDEGFQEALEYEYLSGLVQERIASFDKGKSISFDDLIVSLGFTREEVEDWAEEDRGIDLVNESLSLAKSTRERMLSSMDDGSHSLLSNSKDSY